MSGGPKIFSVADLPQLLAQKDATEVIDLSSSEAVAGQAVATENVFTTDEDF